MVEDSAAYHVSLIFTLLYLEDCSTKPRHLVPGFCFLPIEVI